MKSYAKFLCLGFITMTALTGSASVAPEGTGKEGSKGWKLLAPLPDRVGYAGMFGGVLGGRLIVGSGSQFPEKPLWLKGEKAFSDRIFILSAPDAKWTESKTRLPASFASAAFGATPDAIYLAGGLNATESLRQVYEMRAQGDGFSFKALPDLPKPVGYGVGAIMGGRFYVLGGLDSPTSKSPGVEVWSLALNASEREWRREPDVPGSGFFVAATATDADHVYVFGGVGFGADGKAVPSKSAWRLAKGASAWEKLPELPEGRVGISSPCAMVDGRLFMIGGYADVFPGAPREHPGFSAQTLFFDPKKKRWENGPMLPHQPVPDRDSPGDVGPAPMIGAPCIVWRDHIVVVGGEVRASVRTPTVIAWPLHQ